MNSAAWQNTAKQWVLASANQGKLGELQLALQPLAKTLRPLSDFTAHSPEETGDSFVENALIKARHAAELSGLPSLADDSGLVVDALNGDPGVYSARYAGPNATDADNNRKLLEALADTPTEQRGAHFVCVIALVRSADDPQPLIAEGRWMGRIATSARGQGGFGYDPLFLDGESDTSSAQLSPADKLARSHRGLAIANLLTQLKASA